MTDKEAKDLIITLRKMEKAEQGLSVVTGWNVSTGLYGKAADAIEALLERDRWISASTPPDNPRDVLVTAYYHERWQTLIGWYDVKWHVAAYDKWHEDLSVIAWREKPIPEPPKEDKP